ncbi:MAG: DUF2023 family protein [Rikenellaceae bacterium]
MQVLCHHVYEYQKGLRHLVLHTMKSSDRALAVRKLERFGIEYHIVYVTESKINIFFGSRECVDVVRTFGDVPLYELSHEQDFILGIMLGYDRVAQCERFLKRSNTTLSASIAG